MLGQPTPLILSIQPQSSTGEKSMCSYRENVGSVCLFQEGEQGVSSKQRVAGQMASICEQLAACDLRVDVMFCHLCDTIADVFLT